MDKKIQVIKQLFEGLNEHNKQKVCGVWGENGTVQINNEIKSLDFITSLPDFIGFDLTDVLLLTEDANRSIYEVNWEMIMPSSKGYHNSLITVANIENKSKIISMIDYGRE